MEDEIVVRQANNYDDVGYAHNDFQSTIHYDNYSYKSMIDDIMNILKQKDEASLISQIEGLLYIVSESDIREIARLIFKSNQDMLLKHHLIEPNDNERRLRQCNMMSNKPNLNEKIDMKHKNSIKDVVSVLKNDIYIPKTFEPKGKFEINISDNNIIIFREAFDGIYEGEKEARLRREWSTNDADSTIENSLKDEFPGIKLHLMSIKYKEYGDKNHFVQLSKKIGDYTLKMPYFELVVKVEFTENESINKSKRNLLKELQKEANVKIITPKGKEFSGTIKDISSEKGVLINFGKDAYYINWNDMSYISGRGDIIQVKTELNENINEIESTDATYKIQFDSSYDLMRAHRVMDNDELYIDSREKYIIFTGDLDSMKNLLNTHDINFVVAIQNENINESIKPVYNVFKSTIYRMPTDDELRKFEKFPEETVEQIANEIEYTIIGRGMTTDKNINLMRNAAARLFELFPDNPKYKQLIEKFKNLKSYFTSEQNENINDKKKVTDWINDWDWEKFEQLSKMFNFDISLFVGYSHVTKSPTSSVCYTPYSGKDKILASVNKYLRATTKNIEAVDVRTAKDRSTYDWKFEIKKLNETIMEVKKKEVYKKVKPEINLNDTPEKKIKSFEPSENEFQKDNTRKDIKIEDIDNEFKTYETALNLVIKSKKGTPIVISKLMSDELIKDYGLTLKQNLGDVTGDVSCEFKYKNKTLRIKRDWKGDHKLYNGAWRSDDHFTSDDNIELKKEKE